MQYYFPEMDGSASDPTLSRVHRKLWSVLEGLNPDDPASPLDSSSKSGSRTRTPSVSTEDPAGKIQVRASSSGTAAFRSAATIPEAARLAPLLARAGAGTGEWQSLTLSLLALLVNGLQEKSTRRLVRGDLVVSSMPKPGPSELIPYLQLLGRLPGSSEEESTFFFIIIIIICLPMKATHAWKTLTRIASPLPEEHVAVKLFSIPGSPILRLLAHPSLTAGALLRFLSLAGIIESDDYVLFEAGVDVDDRAQPLPADQELAAGAQVECRMRSATAANHPIQLL